MATPVDRFAPYRNLTVLVAALALVAGHRFWPRPGAIPETTPRPVPTDPTPIAEIEPPTPSPVVAEVPAPAPLQVSLPLDVEAVAKAEAERNAARRERERAEIRADAASQTVRDESIRAATAALSRKALPSTIRDPTARITRATSRTTALTKELDRLHAENAKLAATPRPKGKPLLDKTPVARNVEGEEFHFEIHRDRVAFFDLEKLMEKVRSDAKLRLRMAGGTARRVGGRVGPIGSFFMEYEMAREASMGDDSFDLRAMTTMFQLTGWELVPTGSLRGETYETAMTSVSEFSRALNRLRPGKSTITLWVYPDGFELYRKLRDVLNSRGYTVAARPLPDGMAIRGSPGGSTSAGQ